MVQTSLMVEGLTLNPTNNRKESTKTTTVEVRKMSFSDEKQGRGGKNIQETDSTVKAGLSSLAEIEETPVKDQSGSVRSPAEFVDQYFPVTTTSETIKKEMIIDAIRIDNQSDNPFQFSEDDIELDNKIRNIHRNNLRHCRAKDFADKKMHTLKTTEKGKIRKAAEAYYKQKGWENHKKRH
jgi:hypothetical protein